MPKPTVTTNPVANRYSAPRERIIEFFDRATQKGGLISLMGKEDGTLSVQVYRLDEGVDVAISPVRGGAK